MSLRMFEFRRLAVLSFALLAAGAAPALADEDVTVERAPHHVRMHRTYYHPRPPVVVRQIERVPVPVAVQAPIPVPLVQEPTYQPYYVQMAPVAPVYSGCGGCGTAYVAPAPVYAGCGGCGGYVPTSYCADQPYDGACTAAPVYAGTWPYGYRSRAWLRADRAGCAWAAGRWYCR